LCVLEGFVSSLLADTPRIVFPKGFKLPFFTLLPLFGFRIRKRRGD
jgi:hypothetical protein